MLRTSGVVLLAVVAGFVGSQAFVVSSTSRPVGVANCGAINAAWACNRWVGSAQRQCSQRGSSYGSGRRETQRALGMNSLEEVPESLADKVLALEDSETGKTLGAYAERFAVVDGQRYLVAFPKDPAVAIAFDENDEVAPVPMDDPLMEDLLPLAEACVADLGADVTLLRTPVTLTVQGLDDLVGSVNEDEGIDANGEVGSAAEEGGGAGNDVEGEGEDEEEEEEDEFSEEADEVELLGEFMLEGEEFLLVRFLEPLLILAKEAEAGRFVLLGDEEDQDVNFAVEELLSADAL